MKKSLVVFAILSTMILASCGGKAVEIVATDSTEVAVDSTVVADTVAVEVGGGAEGVEVEAAQGEAVK